MTARTFVPWVEPAAAQLRESRRQIVQLARAIPDDMWGRPSPYPGRTYKDQFAHLAVGYPSEIQEKDDGSARARPGAGARR